MLVLKRQPPLYEAESHASGASTQTVTLLQPLARRLPTSVFLIPTQNASATSNTINVYSTKPCPL